MTHDSDKLIRQLSLVAYLMAEQRPVTARDVKNNVEGYANMGDEAFARRYYADRSELQGLGVPITSGRDEFTGEELYNLREEQYFLPPIDLSDEELAALAPSDPQTAASLERLLQREKRWPERSNGNMMPSASHVAAHPIMYIGTRPSGHLLTYVPHSCTTTWVFTPILAS